MVDILDLMDYILILFYITVNRIVSRKITCMHCYILPITGIYNSVIICLHIILKISILKS